MLKPTPVIDLATFKDYIRLQDPYENAHERARQLAIEPNKKPVYVGYAALESDPDKPVPRDPNSTEFPVTIKTSYAIVRTVQEKTPLVIEKKEEEPPPQVVKLKTSRDDRERGLFEKEAHWQTVVHQERVANAIRSDRKNPLVPDCIEWSMEEVLAWLKSVGMEKYEETFRLNNISGIRLCVIDASRLVSMGIGDRRDIKVITEALRKLTKLPPRPQPHTRDVRKSPLEDIHLYLDFKNVLGKQSETTSFKKFRINHEKAIWDIPERGLQYPGMIIHPNHHRPFNPLLRF